MITNKEKEKIMLINSTEDFDEGKFVREKLELTNKLQSYRQKNLTEKEKIDLIAEQNVLLREFLDGAYEYAVKSAGILGARYAEIRNLNSSRNDFRCMKCNKKMHVGDIALKTEGHDLFGIKVSKYICLDCMDSVLDKMVKDSKTLRKIKLELDDLNRKIEKDEKLDAQEKLKRQAAAYRLRKRKQRTRIHKRGRY